MGRSDDRRARSRWNRLFDFLEQLGLALAAGRAWGSAAAALRLSRQAHQQWGAEFYASLPAGPPGDLPRRVHLAFVGDEPTLHDLA